MTDVGGDIRSASPLEARDAPSARGPVAVVELFTSQGCSSCPPADDVLAGIALDAGGERSRVFPLAFHVDYWDHLGWIDQFADPAYTARQQRYAQAFGQRGLYTPQMVVNGVTEFVGSDRRRAIREISSCLTTSPITVPLAISVDRDTHDRHSRVLVTYTLQRPETTAVLNLAVVEGGLVSDVARGENAGRTLRHHNVVRAFTSAAVEAEQGRVGLNLRVDVDVKRASVIGYVQLDGSTESTAIVGATRVGFPDAAL